MRDLSGNINHASNQQNEADVLCTFLVKVTALACSHAQSRPLESLLCQRYLNIKET